MKCVLRVKTYLRSRTTTEFVVDSDARKYNLASSATEERERQKANSVPAPLMSACTSHMTMKQKLAP